MKRYRFVFSLIFAAVYTAVSNAAPPANDNFVNRASLPGGLFYCNNFDATIEPGEPAHAYSYWGCGSNSIWFTWLAPSTATYTFDTKGSDTGMAVCVYTGNSIDALKKVKYGYGNVSYSATNGTTYQFAIVGLGTFSTGIIAAFHYEANVSPWIISSVQTTEYIRAAGARNGSLAFFNSKDCIYLRYRTNQFGVTVDSEVIIDYYPQNGVTILDKKGNTIINNVAPPNTGTKYDLLAFDGKLLLVYNQENSHVILYKVKNGLALVNEQTVENVLSGLIEGSQIFVVQIKLDSPPDIPNLGFKVFDKKLKNERWASPLKQGMVRVHSFKKNFISRWVEKTHDLNVTFFKKDKKIAEYDIPLPMVGEVGFCSDGKGGILHWTYYTDGLEIVNSPLTYVDRKNNLVFDNKTLADSGNLWNYADHSSKVLFTAVTDGASKKIRSYKIGKDMKKLGEANVNNFYSMRFTDKELRVDQINSLNIGFSKFNRKMKPKWIEPVSPGILRDLRRGVYMRQIITPQPGQTNYYFKIFNKKKTIAEHTIIDN